MENSNNLLKRLGIKLAKARKMKKMTQIGAGKKVSRSRQFVINVEKGETNTRIVDVLELIKAYDCELVVIPKELIGEG